MQIKLIYKYLLLILFFKTASHKPIKEYFKWRRKKNHIMIQVYDERVEAKIGRKKMISIRVQAKRVNNCKHQFHIKVLNQRKSWMKQCFFCGWAFKEKDQKPMECVCVWVDRKLMVNWISVRKLLGNLINKQNKNKTKSNTPHYALLSNWHTFHIQFFLFHFI